MTNTALPRIDKPLDREGAIALAEHIIKIAAPRWLDRRAHIAYFDGQTGAWHAVGLINEAEMTDLRRRIRAVPLHWWDLLGQVDRAYGRLIATLTQLVERLS